MGPKRVELDLKLREPRKHLLILGDAFILLREPTFQQLYELANLTGISVTVKDFLAYIDWSLETLPEIIKFVETMPVRYMQKLLATCNEYFACDESISAQDFIIQDRIDIGLKGSLLGIASKVFKKEFERRQTHFLNELFEGLGVYIKAQKPVVEEEDSDKLEEARSRSWLPLTMAFNPRGYEKIQNSLVYTEEEEVEKSETKLKKEPEKPILTREEHVALIHMQSNDGFIAAAKRGVDAKTYIASRIHDMTPEALQKRNEALKIEEGEVQVVKGRWRSRRG